MQHLSAYEKVQLARHPQRPYFLDYVPHLCPDFIELHGDRKFGDDPAIIGGFGFMHGKLDLCMESRCV
jgi:acetyl-CoA carboxylase carboxyl transferase subunit alpha